MKSKLSKLVLSAVLGLALTLTISCSSDKGNYNDQSCDLSSSSGGKSSSSSDGISSVGIGYYRVWMSKNLNVEMPGSRCDDEIDCEKYGRLYTWEAAKVACPSSGWRLPKDKDWEELIKFIEKENECSECASNYLKTESGWSKGGNGEDKYKFSALPGGFGYIYSVDVEQFGREGYWWSADGSGTYGYFWLIERGNGRMEKYLDDEYDGYRVMYSVRCIKK